MPISTHIFLTILQAIYLYVRDPNLFHNAMTCYNTQIVDRGRQGTHRTFVLDIASCTRMVR